MWRLRLSFLMCAGLAEAQVITTVAGTDVTLLLSGVPAVNAALRGAEGVAVDGAGNVYIADPADNIVARVASDGTLAIVAGNGRGGNMSDGGPATSASLMFPGGVALDSAGTLYIADTGNGRIRKVSGGTITTVAGTGASGFSGEGGPATSASFYPYGVAADSAGNFYIADSLNNRVLKVSGGKITTVAGNGTAGFSGDGGSATSAALNVPEGVAIDSAGNLYIADSSNNRIRRVSGGTITTMAGNGTATFAGDGGPAMSASLSEPFAVAVDSAGNLYIADYGNERVRKVSGGTIMTVAGNGTLGFSGDDGTATNASIDRPEGVALDSAGNLYIADNFHSRIRKVSGGTITTVAGNGGFSGEGVLATSATLIYPEGVAADSAGNLYVADTGNNRIRKVSAGRITTVAGNGTSGYAGDGGPATNASLNLPSSVAVDSAGNVYVVDENNLRIRRVSGGTISTVAGNGTSGFAGDGSTAIASSLNDPMGVAVDSADNLYIADSLNSRVRKVSGGTITTVAGNGAFGFAGDGGAAISASLNLPKGVTVDSTGNLYIADSVNNRIRKVSGGTISTVAGNGTSGFAGDGGLATNASLQNPKGVAVDSAGNLYIADTGNDCIREVLAGTPAYQASPLTLSFSGTAGGSATSGQVISLSAAIAGLAFTTSVSASWLTVTPSAGTISTTLQVTADPTALGAGSYQGTIAITVPNAAPA